MSLRRRRGSSKLGTSFDEVHFSCDSEGRAGSVLFPLGWCLQWERAAEMSLMSRWGRLAGLAVDP